MVIMPSIFSNCLFFCYSVSVFYLNLNTSLVAAVDQEQCGLHNNIMRRRIINLIPGRLLQGLRNFHYWKSPPATQPFSTCSNWKDLSCMNSCFPKTPGWFRLRNNSCLNVLESDETGIFHIETHPRVHQKLGSSRKTLRLFKFLINP